MKLRSMITTELPNPQQHPQMLSMKSQIEYEIVANSTLARSIKTEYDEMALLYDRILRHRQIPVNKSDTTWNWSFNTPCKSLKGILVLFEGEQPKKGTRQWQVLQSQNTKSLCHCGGRAKSAVCSRNEIV